MDFMTNGSKTLVACAGILGLAAMACFKVIDGVAASTRIGAIVTAYFGLNVYQNGKTNVAPPTP